METRAAEKALEEIHARIAKCTKCPLHESRTNPVPGEGPPDAKVMFIGEAPGAEEDKQGRPFVGPAGRFLTSLLEIAGLKREEVFITNIVKCRPPGNREPKPNEVEACKEYLLAQIAAISPKVICLLGSPALKTVLDPKLSISRVHGTPFRRQGILYVPLYHPAAALHRQDLKPALKEDFMRLKTILEQELGG